MCVCGGGGGGGGIKGFKMDPLTSQVILQKISNQTLFFLEKIKNLGLDFRQFWGQICEIVIGGGGGGGSGY